MDKTDKIKDFLLELFGNDITTDEVEEMAKNVIKGKEELSKYNSNELHFFGLGNKTANDNT